MGIIQDRRALHRIPELELCLPRTMEYLSRSLSGLDCRVFSPVDSSLCAFFDFGAEEAIAFRADCDALPLTEKSGVEFVSEHPGRMHACGHDGHMAILLELARRLDKRKRMEHNVLLVFQPGEESPGGAKPICETGIFETYHVKAIFGLHLWPGLEAGKVFSRKGELMARSSEVNVDIYGRSAHIAKAAEGVDALAAMVDFYSRVTALEQGLPKEVYRLLKFGHLTSGTVRNALSAHARLEGSLRAFQDEVFEDLRDGIFQAGKAVERQYGCRCEITLSDGYPAVMNPAFLYNKVKEAAEFEDLAQPSMTSEDFAWYQKYIPGMFFFLGLGDVPALHADDFHFDDSLLEKGADFLEQLAVAYRIA